MTDVNSASYWDATYVRHAVEGTTAQVISERLPAWEAILPLLPSTGRLLDVGCAGGDFLHFVHRRHPHLELFGVEHSAVAVRQGQKTEPTATYVHGDGVTLQAFTAQMFDAVYSGHFLEHVGDPVAALTSQRRVLRPGGLVIVLFPYGDDPYVEHVHDDLDSDTVGGWLAKAGLTEERRLPIIPGTPVDQGVVSARRL